MHVTCVLIRIPLLHICIMFVSPSYWWHTSKFITFGNYEWWLQMFLLKSFCDRCVYISRLSESHSRLVLSCNKLPKCLNHVSRLRVQGVHTMSRFDVVKFQFQPTVSSCDIHLHYPDIWHLWAPFRVYMEHCILFLEDRLIYWTLIYWYSHWTIFIWLFISIDLLEIFLFFVYKSFVWYKNYEYFPSLWLAFIFFTDVF
jgi:hypothetical protein